METAITWRPPATLDAVKGWFYGPDQAVTTWLLDRQERLEEPGDLLELGCYMGRSAIVIGTHLRDGETFTVCDLFGADPADERNTRENKGSYASLTRQAFENNYLTFHEELPVVVQATTDQITAHVAPGTCRFVHVDASHLWQHVRGDIEAARDLLRLGGIVVCDDYRSIHTPGVAAAVWTAVANEGLRPICVTGNKFYGTWGDATEIQNELVDWLATFGPGLAERQNVLGQELIRVCKWDKPPLPVVPPLHPVEEEEPPPQPVVIPAQRKPQPSTAKRLARDLLPPVVTRAIKRARAR